MVLGNCCVELASNLGMSREEFLWSLQARQFSFDCECLTISSPACAPPPACFCANGGELRQRISPYQLGWRRRHSSECTRQVHGESSLRTNLLWISCGQGRLRIHTGGPNDRDVFAFVYKRGRFEGSSSYDQVKAAILRRSEIAVSTGNHNTRSQTRLGDPNLRRSQVWSAMFEQRGLCQTFLWASPFRLFADLGWSPRFDFGISLIPRFKRAADLRQLIGLRHQQPRRGRHGQQRGNPRDGPAHGERRSEHECNVVSEHATNPRRTQRTRGARGSIAPDGAAPALPSVIQESRRHPNKPKLQPQRPRARPVWPTQRRKLHQS